MGISGFNSWLKENYPQCYKSENYKKKYEYIYIDINHVLHQCIYSCKTEDTFLNKLENVLDLILSTFIATKKIILAVDGPSPYSKVILQRKRRMDLENYSKNSLNPICLTPGTTTMNQIDIFLNEYAKKFKKNYKFLNPEINVFQSNYPDEGEIKIFRELIKYGNMNTLDSHLIISNDADIVLLALSIKPIYNINIFIKCQDGWEILEVKKFLICLHKNINSFKYSINLLKNSQIRDDFVILSLMKGNDYLKKIKCISSLDILWETYLSCINKKNLFLLEGLIDQKTKSFNIKFLLKFMFKLNKKIKNKKNRKLNLENYNENNVKKYLEGILWCWNMYRTAECSMYDYIYTGDNSISPIDIFYYLNFNKNSNILIPYSSTPPISSNIYTLITMPKKAKDLIPQKYHRFLDNELKSIYSEEECKECNQLKKNLKIKRTQIRKLNKIDNEEKKELLKNKEKELQNKFLKHKIVHKKDTFTINNVKHIIELTKNI